MELNFERRDFSCLEAALREVRSSEQTQTIVLPDGMPDVGKVLGAWGQCIQRGKEWRGGDIVFTGGMMVWVLYAPEDGSEPRWIDAWVPFSLQWDLPDGTPEGDIRMKSLVRSVDARSVSPRKLLVRAGMGAMAEAYVPMEAEVYEPDKIPGDVQLLSSTYPIRLPKEMGEKSFLVDEELTLPDSAPQPEKIIYYRMSPEVLDKKVLSDKAVFRGNANLHILYRSEGGQLHSWDFPLPYSQYAELSAEHGSDAQVDLQLMPTSMEVELDEEGHIRAKSGIVAQYLITDKQMLELIEDAYSPSRELNLQVQNLQLPAVLDTRRETLSAEQSVTAEANVVADVTFLPDFPRQQQEENQVQLEIPGAFQMLYYGEDGALHAGSARWEGQHSVSADDDTHLNAQIFAGEEAQTAIGNGTISAKCDLPLDLTATTRQEIPMVTGLTLGDQRKLDPNRPSLILRRTGEDRLWDIAKASNSTVEAIRKANNLQDEPMPNQMLLIPVS